MRALVLALALVLGSVACDSGPESVIWTSRCNMKCGNVSKWSELAFTCDAASLDEKERAQSLADTCVGVLLGEGCAVGAAQCFCEVDKTDDECR